MGLELCECHCCAGLTTVRVYARCWKKIVPQGYKYILTPTYPNTLSLALALTWHKLVPQGYNNMLTQHITHPTTTREWHESFNASGARL